MRTVITGTPCPGQPHETQDKIVGSQSLDILSAAFQKPKYGGTLLGLSGRPSSLDIILQRTPSRMLIKPPTSEMKTEAVSAGFYQAQGWGRKFPKIQILTIADLLQGADVQMPPAYGTFREAQRVRQAGGDQLALDVE
jgi:hypothetical protein